jgi:hypothetical protein
MKIKELHAFVQKIKNNVGLKETLGFARDAEAVAAIGRKVGLNLSAHTMTHYPKSLDGLGPDELETVTGGNQNQPSVQIASSTHINNWTTTLCGCHPN